MANRLAQSLSPYLLQHGHNPVDWQPWDDLALAQARRENKPIFLSIGYSACHWCHVMERESFENPEVARELNKHFVAIKVDREERPDLDDLYMDAVQTLTGHGGWPMSVWLTPDLKPFYGGTYFPPEPRRGMPGFIPLLKRIAELWLTQRKEVESQASELTEELHKQARVQAGGIPDESIFEAALGQLRTGFDATWGGFGAAPKFPQQMAVELILRRGSEADQSLARRTLDAMWEGGMYDHLGGGFSRYSVDGRWLVPHFEKMLYDNAQLIPTYLAAFQKFGDERYAEVARECLDYLLKDLQDASGGFHSTEDADSEGEEGKFYAFTPEDMDEALGIEAGARACAFFGVSQVGNFEHGTSVLHRFSMPTGMKVDEAELQRWKAALLAFREKRIRPAKDDKILASWNGLTLTALARGYQVLGDTRYLKAAESLAGFLKTELWGDDGLYRVWRHGKRHTKAFLEDYAALANGLVDLFEAGFQAHWLRWAEEVATRMCDRFEDAAEGGFFSTEAGQQDLLFRQKPGFDNAVPSGNTLAASALLRLSRHLEREDFARSADRTLACFGPWMRRAPRAFLGMLAVLDAALREPLEIVLAGDPAHPETLGMIRAAQKTFCPHRTLSLVAADPSLPLHRGRTTEKPLAYICKGHTCAAPVDTVDALLSGL